MRSQPHGQSLGAGRSAGAEKPLGGWRTNQPRGSSCVASGKLELGEDKEIKNKGMEMPK